MLRHGRRFKIKKRGLKPSQRRSDHSTLRLKSLENPWDLEKA